MAALGGKYPFVVILKNKVSTPVNIIGFLLNMGACGFFLKEFVGPLVGSKEMSVMLIIAILIIIILLGRNFIRQQRGHKIFFDRIYLITALLWLKMPYMQWLFIPFVILAFLEHQVKFPMEIGFSESRIVFNTFFKKKYNWSQLTNVMLKDGLLTMDFRNNRLLQREIEDEEDEDDASEEEFNLFCQEQLKKSLLDRMENVR